MLGQQQVRGSNPGSNNSSNGSAIAQLPDVNVDAEDPLPGYTPSSNFGNCAADNLDTAYEKVVDVTYNRGTVTELTTRRVLSSSNNVIMYHICNCRNDIGIAVDCLQQCNDAGASCLAVLLRNERGGRQSCSSVTRCRDIIYTYYLHISTLYLSTILRMTFLHLYLHRFIYLSTIHISMFSFISFLTSRQNLTLCSHQLIV